MQIYLLHCIQYPIFLFRRYLAYEFNCKMKMDITEHDVQYSIEYDIRQQETSYDCGTSQRTINNNRPQVLCPGGIYSWWHSASSANGSRSHDSAPVSWAYGIPCPVMVSPNASQLIEDELLYPDDHLIWYAEVDSGPRTSLSCPRDFWTVFGARRSSQTVI